MRVVSLDSKSKFYSIIDKLVEFNKVSHAYLVEVDDYDEDFKCILDFVKLILCKKDKKRCSDLNCSNCNICRLVDTDNYVDLKIIEPDGSMIKKKQMLDLQDEFNNKSLLDNKRIYIIKEADKLNQSSANTILKFLEEPEDDIVAILVTNNRYSVIETILSRCQILSLKKLVLTDIEDEVIDLLDYIVGKSKLFINYQEIFSNILPDKVIAKERLLKLEEVLVNYLKHLSCSDFECNDSVLTILKDVKLMQITNYISIIEGELAKLEYNVNYKLWLDSLFAKLIIGG